MCTEENIRVQMRGSCTNTRLDEYVHKTREKKKPNNEHWIQGDGRDGWLSRHLRHRWSDLVRDGPAAVVAAEAACEGAVVPMDNVCPFFSLCERFFEKNGNELTLLKQIRCAIYVTPPHASPWT